MTIRVLLADDQALIRTSFRVLIESEPDLEVVGEAATGNEAVRLARSTRADVVLMDIMMPGMDGLAATRAISADESLAGVRVLMLTTLEADEYVFQALRAGASGILGTGVALCDLLRAIRLVAGGEALLSPGATKTLIAHYLATPDLTSTTAPELMRLTEREREVFVLVAAGLSNDLIAEQLHVSPSTAKTHVNRIMAKLGVRGRAQLVAVAYRTGYVHPRGMTAPAR
ncbi:response regulator transcription factor [Streptomyces europaeiscabiei]|uniref:Response regulator transcription factor n=1 Tax=Streptomyces europaeiscabiei TaxID=146819 RepID=A0ABU4NGG3_9ACTN|nr:response regulator transcription factor [Streptomyces europaeiscabiei]MDX2756958.1 response regulator transcription factor [Streptomyces europaeiscabiei]MDX2756959.1 response regulator transcription factor [Streptomyces europaeiscabiei]MDX2766652.1 response regulator transcription factor [Streptomyces europaeiscabiei]MDX3544221.1 response regulator transcription factor [Streptomyces europaeiscabiei]MDX3552455.1 response regulator transcription factor [Streptomyces europaeiscabiei]